MPIYCTSSLPWKRYGIRYFKCKISELLSLWKLLQSRVDWIPVMEARMSDVLGLWYVVHTMGRSNISLDLVVSTSKSMRKPNAVLIQMKCSGMICFQLVSCRQILPSCTFSSVSNWVGKLKRTLLTASFLVSHRRNHCIHYKKRRKSFFIVIYWWQRWLLLC